MNPGLLFIDATPAGLSPELLQTLLSPALVLILKCEDMGDAGQLVLAASLRAQGLGLALRNVDLAFLKANGPLLSQASYVLVGSEHPEVNQICSYARQRPTLLRVVVEDAHSWRKLDDSAALQAYGFFGDLCLAPRQTDSPTQLAPQALQILQLMQMVQGNADIRQLEKVLKSDVSLSYKLLRYINSAGFGLEVKIESPRHAVAMLGYAPLFRWLLLLLARTNTKGISTALMQAAMVRGRFAELLGQGFFSPREAENLYVVGMYSFLDRALGIPVTQILAQLALPEAVAQALESRDGVYGPVLALAEASEREDGGAATLAQAMGMRSAHVNQAHLTAIAWAQGIKL